MTTQNPNEAAEKLQNLMRDALFGGDSRTLGGLLSNLDAALATERRNTVKRIRAEIGRFAILDQIEADR